MTRTLQKIGNSRGLVLTRTMLDHLGITDTVEITLEEGRIVLAPPQGAAPRRQSFEQASESTFAQYDDAMRRLADAGNASS
jgi:antitoxin component of MazEF toxin-antitoxin module